MISQQTARSPCGKSAESSKINAHDIDESTMDMMSKNLYHGISERPIPGEVFTRLDPRHAKPLSPIGQNSNPDDYRTFPPGRGSRL